MKNNNKNTSNSKTITNKNSKKPIKKHNVLVVDDIETNLDLIEKLLVTIDKYLVTTCLNGFKAIEILNETKEDPNKKIDLIILDIKMPVMNGFETCKKIRELDFTIPIIFLSGLDEADNIVQGFEAGGNDYIKKPFELFQLVARIDSQLKLHSLAKLQEKMRSLEMYNALVVATNHNLRQPLTIIAGNIELFMMKEEKNLDDTSKKFIKRVNESVDLAVDILDKFKYNKNPTFENYTKNLKMVKLLENMVEDKEVSFDDGWDEIEFLDSF